jgi:hypothetical protein
MALKLRGIRGCSKISELSIMDFGSAPQRSSQNPQRIEFGIIAQIVVRF